MIQFYFLSILFNTLAGYALIVDGETGHSALDGLKTYFLNETFRLVVGILVAATGFFKLLSAVRGDVPVVGDLLPALAGLAAGFILLFEYYRSRSTVSSTGADRIETIFVNNRKWFGYVAVGSAAAHFLFPTVLFL